MLTSQLDIIRLIENDKWMMDILKAAQKLQLPDWWICAGFVRSKIWDYLHGFVERTELPDIDVVYFDAVHMTLEQEKQYEKQLHEYMPGLPWSAKNQARMHERNNVPPYQSTVDGIAKFPETATALGVRLGPSGQLFLAAPHGVEDVIHMRVKPTKFFQNSPERMAVYKQRIATKKWHEQWNRITYD